MGIWEFVNSGTDAVKRNVPGLNTVQGACKTTYSYGAAAVTKIDKVIRIDGLQTISSRMPDEQSRAQIGLFASRFAQNATGYAVKEGAKMLIPGGKAIAEIYDKTIHDVKRENQSKFQENVSKKEVIGGNEESGRHTGKRGVVEVLEKQGKEGMQIISETQPYCISKCNEETSSRCSANEKQLVAYPNGIQQPEDVLRVFMMKEFIGARILDDLLIPQSRRGKGTTNSNFVA